jgi:hypothetical protein
VASEHPHVHRETAWSVVVKRVKLNLYDHCERVGFILAGVEHVISLLEKIRNRPVRIGVFSLISSL